jgi:hypothetical protein
MDINFHTCLDIYCWPAAKVLDRNIKAVASYKWYLIADQCVLCMDAFVKMTAENERSFRGDQSSLGMNGLLFSCIPEIIGGSFKSESKPSDKALAIAAIAPLCWSRKSRTRNSGAIW